MRLPSAVRRIVHQLRERWREGGAGTPAAADRTAARRAAARLELYRAAMTDLEVRDVVLITRGRGLGPAKQLHAAVADRDPAVTIHLLATSHLRPDVDGSLPAGIRHHRCRSAEERARLLRTVSSPQLIVEHGLDRDGDRAATFRELFGCLSEGGRYLLAGRVTPTTESSASRPDGSTDSGLPDEPATFPTWLSTLVRDEADPRVAQDEAGLVRSIASTVVLPGGALVGKRFSHAWKLRDRRATVILTQRFGSAWGEELASKPALTFESRAVGATFGDGLRQLKPTFAVPERFLRRYREVICLPRKRVRLGDHWLPDTFRNPQMRRLGHRVLESVSASLARAPDEAGLSVREVEGPCYYLDAEYLGHFGHVLTDVVSNVWGWQTARERAPGIRPLLSLAAGQEQMPDFQRQILAALDVEVDDVEYLRAGTAVRVPELYSCSADWALPTYVAPELAAVWNRIRQRCATPVDPQGPRRIFVTRPPRGVRTCLNSEEVEAFFRERDFTVIRPETLPFGEQIALFAGAEVIAGFSGSGMFNAMFAPASTRVIALTGSSFTALNEYLIKSVVGGPVAYLWSPSQIDHPATGWTWQAYRSNFVFDLERFRPDLERLIETG